MVQSSPTLLDPETFENIAFKYLLAVKAGKASPGEPPKPRVYTWDETARKHTWWEATAEDYERVRKVDEAIEVKMFGEEIAAQMRAERAKGRGEG